MYIEEEKWGKKKANSLLPGAPRPTQEKQNKSSKVMESTKKSSEFSQKIKAGVVKKQKKLLKTSGGIPAVSRAALSPFSSIFQLYPEGRSEEQALLCWMLHPFPAQCTSALRDVKWGDVGTLPKQRNLKKTGLAVQANTVPAPLAFSELPSQ